MPVLTEFDGSLLTVGADVVGVTLPATSVLNDFEAPQSFTHYNVADDDSGPHAVEQGDHLAPVINGVSLPGTYLGSGQLMNAGLTVGSPTGGALSLNLGLSVVVNPVPVDYFRSEDGSLYFISENPLSDEHLMATLTIKLPLVAVISVSVPVSELSGQLALLDPTGLLGPLLGGVGDMTQYVMNTAIVTNTFDPDGSMTLTDDDINAIVCFTRDTLIQTPSGEVPVEALEVGDLVLTRDNGAQPVRWIGAKRITTDILASHPSLRPIRIRAGALGCGMPSADLVVSPQHRVLVRSKIAQRMFGTAEVLVAARQLLELDGVAIATDLDEVEYFHFLFEHHEIVTSNGAETESLFTGKQALKSLGRVARDEIEAIFPELCMDSYQPVGARLLPSGRQARRMVARHLQNGRALLM